MAETIVDALLVTLGIDSSEYRQGMEEADRATKDFSEKAPRQAEQGLNKIEQKFGMTFQGIFRSFIAPLTAALGTMGVFSQYTQTADRIGKMSARIGMDAEKLQAWGEAAKRAGGSAEGFMNSVESLNFRLSRMQLMGGKGPLAKLFSELNIKATENGRLKDAFQIMQEIAGAMDRMDKVEVAKKLRFAGIDTGTIQLLQMGRISMDELIKRMRDLGGYTKEDFEITARFNDAISDLQQSFRAMAAPILRVITPALATLAEWLTKIVKTFREHQGFIVAGLTVIAATMSGVLLKAATALGTALAPLLAPIAAIAGLGIIFDEIATYAQGGETAFEGLWRAIGTPEQYMAVGTAIKDGLLKAWDEVKAALVVVGGYLVKVGEALSPLVDIVTPLVDAFKSLLSTAWELLAWGGEFAAKIAAMLLPLDEVFSPGEPGDGWSALRKIAAVVSLAFQSLSYVIKEISDWIGSMTSKAREALKALDFLEPFKKLAGEIAGYFGGMFNPGQPGSEWSVLRGIIDGIKDAIDLMIGGVKKLLGWVTSAVDKIRSWLGIDPEQERKDREAAKGQVLAGKTEDQYIAEKAAEIQKTAPGMTPEAAKEAAKAELDTKVGQKAALNNVNAAVQTAADMGDPDVLSDDDVFAALSNMPALATKKADTAQAIDASKTNNISIKSDTTINQTITGATPENAREIGRELGNATQRGVEHGGRLNLDAMAGSQT